MTAVPYTRVRKAVPLLDVIKRYSDVPEEGSVQIRMRCMLCDYANKSLSINTEKNVFKCFHCKAGGNLFNFVAAADDVTEAEACRRIMTWFSLDEPAADAPNNKPQKAAPKKKETGPDDDQVCQYNKPLSFTLKNIDTEHKRLDALGLSRALLDAYEIGVYTGKGYFADCIVIPLHNPEDEIIGYCGIEENGTIKLPQRQYFNPDVGLFNLNRWTADDPVIITRSPLDALRIYELIGVHALSFYDGVISESQYKALQNMIELIDQDSVWYYQSDESAEDLGTIVKGSPFSLLINPPLP